MKKLSTLVQEIFKYIKIYYLIAPFIFISCKGDNNKLGTDEKALGNIITLSYDPKKVIWSYGSNEKGLIQFGPTDYDIKAILTYDKSTYDRIKQNSVQLENNSFNLLKKTFMEDWFTPEVKNCFKVKGSSLSVLEPTYEINLFAKNPFYNGFCFFAEDNQIFIFMYTN